MKTTFARYFSLVAICVAAGIVATGCGGSSSGGSSVATNVMYIETNNPALGQNSVIAYRLDPSTGAPTMLGEYDTGGTGFFNSDQRLGPDDHDKEIAASSNHRFLFVANQGSNDVSVFKIGSNGSLSLIGSPISSDGIQPASLSYVNGRLYVVNRGDGILMTGTEAAVTGTPGATNYTGFDVNSDGTLTHIARSTVVLDDGSSPSQVIAAVGGSGLFGNNFFVPDGSVTPPAPIFPAARSYLDPLAISSSGGLTLGTAVTLPSPTYDGAPYILGLATHPTQKVLYAGIVGFGTVGVWTYDNSGALTFSSAENSNGVAPAGGLCWIALDPNAKFMYTSSVGPDQIGVLSIGADPTVVTRLQDFDLGGPKDTLVNQPEPYKYTTAPFNLQVAPSGKFLYVLSNQTCVNASIDPQCVNGTTIHTLAIAADGTLSEATGSPLIISTAAMGAQGGIVPYHATGMIVF